MGRCTKRPCFVVDLLAEAAKTAGATAALEAGAGAAFVAFINAPIDARRDASIDPAADLAWNNARLDDTNRRRWSGLSLDSCSSTSQHAGHFVICLDLFFCDMHL